MREETLQELQENNAVVHINGSMEEQNSSEGEKSNFTDVTLEETNGDHVEQYVIREWISEVKRKKKEAQNSENGIKYFTYRIVKNREYFIGSFSENILNI